MDRKEMKDYVRNLSESDACTVLMTLLNDDPALVEKAYGIAMSTVDSVDVDDVAEWVYDDLNAFDLDDLQSRSGSTRYGYVDPNDAAWEMFEETVESYLEEMRKYLKHALPDVAKTYCMGIIKGLIRYEREAASEISDWMPDAPGDCITTVFEEWMEGAPSPEDVADVKEIIDGAGQ